MHTPFNAELPNLTCTGGGLVLGGQPLSRPKRAEPRAPQFLEISSIYDYSLKMNDQVGCGNTWGGTCFKAGQPHPSFQSGVALADPNFVGYPLLVRTQLDLQHYITLTLH